MTPITTRFYRSVYISLGLACACLGYAEVAFLPEVSVFVGIVGLLLVAAYLLEGRWALSIRAANVLGAFIAAIAAVWVAYQFVRPYGALIDQLPSPTWLLPYLGPLLMILIPAKLIRPKHDGDFWSLQGIGLIAVSLGCALTGDPSFGVLLLAYVISGLWSLTLFYYYRQARLAGAGPVRAAAPPRSLAQAGRWGVVATAIAVGLFLCTPRATEARWELAGASYRMQTGVDETRPGIDLNRSGTLTVNRDKVVDVFAYTDKAETQPKVDLDPGQRWRQMTFDSYSAGRWENRPHFGLAPEGRPNGWGFARSLDSPRTPPDLPDLGPGQYYLVFHAAARPGRLTAEPYLRPADADGRPVLTLMPVVPRVRPPSTEYPPPFGQPAHAYKQVTRPMMEPGVGLPYPAARDRLPEPYELDSFRLCQGLPHLSAWTRALFGRLISEGKLPATLSPFAQDGNVPEKYYEAVARAFEAHLSNSGEFKYSLTLRRHDTHVDPVEDFVVNTKTGHCTRFATALSLMLRSVGVPTRVVLGFRGFETAGDGVYEVQQCHAHSWVEALILRTPSNPGESPWHWLTLDPSPLVEEVAAGDVSWGQWWETTRQQVNGWFKNFIIEYDADQQERARYAVTKSEWVFPAVVRRALLGPDGRDWGRASLMTVAALAVVFATRRGLRRWRKAGVPKGADATNGLYARLVALGSRALGRGPRTGETAGEFADAAGDELRTSPDMRPVADIPADTAAVYYRVRFGDRPLAAEERQAVDDRLRDLDAALARPSGR